MRIFTNNVKENEVADGSPPMFVMYLDTQKTGDESKDITHISIDMTGLEELKDPDQIISLLSPLLSELVYNAYGEKVNKTPLTDWHATGFDRNYPNGVNTGS